MCEPYGLVHFSICVSFSFFYSNRLDAFGTLFPFIINCIATLTAYKDYKNLFRIPFIVSALFSCPKIQMTYIIVQFDLIPLWLLAFFFFSCFCQCPICFILNTYNKHTLRVYFLHSLCLVLFSKSISV